MRHFLITLCFLILQNVLAEGCCQEQTSPPWWKNGWAITVFGGPLTTQTSSKILKHADFENSGIIALAGSKELINLWENRFDFELEAQAVQHIGEQSHFEINPIVLIFRWKSFPWNTILPTTFAIGDGISIATQRPHLEVKRRGKDKTSDVLNYVMAELTLSLPDYPQWALVARYHHRSGVFGKIHGVEDASTAFAGGLKYWF
ncbi:MAG: hypothetical protein K2P93_00065 [Alphaproteobacteria bacterium]|nr:hypothetical protein [Alphaproteobacteria bacterium]